MTVEPAVDPSPYARAVRAKLAQAERARAVRAATPPVRNPLSRYTRRLDNARNDPPAWLRILAFAIRRYARRELTARSLPTATLRLVRFRGNPNADACYYLELPLQGDCADLRDLNAQAYWLSRILAKTATKIARAWGASQWQSRFFPGASPAAAAFRWFHGVRKTVDGDPETGSESDAHYAPKQTAGSVEGVQDAHSDLSGSARDKNRPSCLDRTDWYLRLVGAPFTQQQGGYDHGHAGQDLVYIRLYLLVAKPQDAIYTQWIQRRSRIMGGPVA